VTVGLHYETQSGSDLDFGRCAIANSIGRENVRVA